jgi:hypothetical protein
MKKIMIITAIAAIGLFFFQKYNTPELKNQEAAPGETVGKAVLNTALQVSEMDAAALAGISEKLETACAKNKYGLSENECVLAIRNRKDICTQQTAQNFPGQFSNTDKMQAAVVYYVDCLFQRQ